VVLVGNAKAFVPQLRTLGLSDIETIPVEQLDLMSATLKRETGLRASSAPVSQVKVASAFLTSGASAKVVRRKDGETRLQLAYQATQTNPRAGGGQLPTAQNATALNDRATMDLLRRVVDARGGLMLLKGIRTVIAETVTTFMTQQGPPLPATTRTYIVYPDKFRVDAELEVPDQNGRPVRTQTTQAFNAGRAWVKDPRGVQDAPPPMAAEFASNVRRDIIPLLIAAAEGRLTVRKLPDQTGRDLRPVQVLEISGLQINRVRLMIDSQMLIVGQTYTTPSPLGGQSPGILNEEVFSDYRFVNGIRVPFETQLLQNGQPVIKRTITKVSFNEAVPDNLFTRPL
jgi:hypothetical protein